MTLVVRIAAIATLAAVPVAHADGWLVAETPAAVALSDAQQGVFRPGLMPAFGAYVDNDRAALGVRLRAGVLRNGPAPGGHLEDPGMGGLVTGALAFRVLAGGGWVELAGGGGVTGRDLVPTVELGVGWSFRVGDVGAGPSARIVRVFGDGEMDTFGSADMALIGLDLRFGKDRAKRRPILERPAVAVAAPRDVVGPVDRDADEVVEHELSCAQLLDGCPLDRHITIENDRIVLDERVLFDLNRSRVRSEGRAIIARIAELWRLHPEWKRITIEGHTCHLGTDEYNQTLSEQRAERAREVLLRYGFDASLVGSVGYGRTRPRSDDTTEQGRQRNRRVEFAIEREGVTP